MCSLIGVGMGMQLVGNIAQGQAAKMRGEAAKAEDYRSADATERAAADAIERGNLHDMQVVMHGSSVVAAQRVVQSGTGADVNVGAHLATQQATSAVSDVDRAAVRRNASLQAYGLKQQARGYRQRGQYEEAEGDAAFVGSFLAGIGGAASMGSQLAVDREAAPAVAGSS